MIWFIWLLIWTRWICYTVPRWMPRTTWYTSIKTFAIGSSPAFWFPSPRFRNRSVHISTSRNTKFQNSTFVSRVNEGDLLVWYRFWTLKQEHREKEKKRKIETDEWESDSEKGRRMPLGASRVPFNIHLQIQQNLEITITRTILNRSDLKTESTIGNSIAINLKNGFELETQKLRVPKTKLQKIQATQTSYSWI